MIYFSTLTQINSLSGSILSGIIINIFYDILHLSLKHQETLKMIYFSTLTQINSLSHFSDLSRQSCLFAIQNIPPSKTIMRFGSRFIFQIPMILYAMIETSN